MRIFLAGATGVIGRRLVLQLIAAGHQVTAVARSEEKRAAIRSAGATAVTVDLFDPVAVRNAVRGHDAIINLATHIPPSSRALLPWAWKENQRVRRTVPANLVDGALDAGAGRVIQESFAPVYRDSGEEWIDEKAPIKLASYNDAVADAEKAVARFTESGGIGVVLRFGLFYGPDSDFTRDMIASIRKGWAPSLGRKEGFISSISHDDAATAVVAALTVPAGIYNVVDDEPLRRRDYFDSLAKALGVAPAKFPPSWLWRLMGSVGETLARSQRISNRKFREASRWTPRWRSVRDGWMAIQYQP